MAPPGCCPTTALNSSVAWSSFGTISANKSRRCRRQPGWGQGWSGQGEAMLGTLLQHAVDAASQRPFRVSISRANFSLNNSSAAADQVNSPGDLKPPSLVNAAVGA